MTEITFTDCTDDEVKIYVKDSKLYINCGESIALILNKHDAKMTKVACEQYLMNLGDEEDDEV